MITIAIAGTAGRKDDAARLTRALYQECQEKLLATLEEIGEPRHLVSGGAAYADHLAVRLFLKGKAEKLTLHLPCAWAGTKFADTGVFDWKTNPGGTANALHRKFQANTGIESFKELAAAIANPNCTTTVSPGFHARNALMAKANALVALTFGRRNAVKDGGTANTCRSYLDNVRRAQLPDLSFHIDLSRQPLVAYKGILA